jgi:YidC/Oxa1 family membrane protein insertase
VKISGNESRDIDFHYASPEGVVVRKTYTLTGNSYSIALKEQLANSASTVRKAAPQIVLSNRIDPKGEEASFESYGPVSYSNELITEKVKDLLKGARTYPGGITWTGFGDKYFLNAIIGENASIGSVQIVRTPTNHVENIITAPEVTLNPGQTTMVSYKVYLGPKDLDILKAQGNSLEEAIDFGWFSALAKPLLYAMKYFYKYTGNYGIAIIIITVILKILFFPLTHKSYKSMKEMQKLQPKMNELREKFKNDRDAMNRAVMELYKTHKVNPLGGCLPMLVQIPVFFALYKALMYSIELRHAPFMLWITDLSGKDPYYVTPIIMGVTMFIQQKMTPTNMDPVQAKMMLALPIVFTFMFLNFPSGLVLYWLVNNILTIAQQAYINKSLATE